MSRKQRRMKRVGVSTSERQRAMETNAVWSWDFVHDQTEDGGNFRILTLLDEYARRCLAVHVGRSIRAVDVITVVEAAFARYGATMDRNRSEAEIACCRQPKGRTK